MPGVRGLLGVARFARRVLRAGIGRDLLLRGVLRSRRRNAGRPGTSLTGVLRAGIGRDLLLRGV
ncbi:hypothetical protein, partial [Spongiactinospora gelatinilytica]|uniref:hypothetical protein n=1 Tax=Spongiactinospora gelatinilytica TaxID=2666298 RepID=UPI0011B9392F